MSISVYTTNVLAVGNKQAHFSIDGHHLQNVESVVMWIVSITTLDQDDVERKLKI